MTSEAEVSIQEIHDVVRQALLGLAREVAYVAKQDGDVQFALFRAGNGAQFLKVEDDHVLGALQQPAGRDVAVNSCLASEAGELVPAALRCDPLFKSGAGGDMRKAFENLHAAGGAAPKGAALVVMWNPILDGRVEQCLPARHLDRNFVRVGDPVHCVGLLKRGSSPSAN
jgi:hypothetical protein